MSEKKGDQDEEHENRRGGDEVFSLNASFLCLLHLVTSNLFFLQNSLPS
jgi:hypothetical protein